MTTETQEAPPDRSTDEFEDCKHCDGTGRVRRPLAPTGPQEEEEWMAEQAEILTQLAELGTRRSQLNRYTADGMKQREQVEDQIYVLWPEATAHRLPVDRIAAAVGLRSRQAFYNIMGKAEARAAEKAREAERQDVRHG